MMKSTDSVKYNVVVSREESHIFDNYSTAREFALANEALWIDVSILGPGFGLVTMVAKIESGHVIEIKPQYIKRG